MIIKITLLIIGAFILLSAAMAFAIWLMNVVSNLVWYVLNKIYDPK